MYTRSSGSWIGLPQYGNAFSAIKQASWEDFNYATLAEVEAQLHGAGSRIVR
ncbi:MAG TPA: hypothetical protein VNF73_03425 [Candidatus Saccharimonadales bacterium]|nr:hypothetical protein [Candidatus Saccharimonadales bacterium]